MRQEIQSLPVLAQRTYEPSGLADRVPESAPTHAMYLIDVDGRQFAICHTCSAAGDEVAIELFDDADLSALACPVDLAWRIYRADAARLFDQTVFRSLNGARREAENCRAALLSVRS